MNRKVKITRILYQHAGIDTMMSFSLNWSSSLIPACRCMRGNTVISKVVPVSEWPETGSSGILDFFGKIRAGNGKSHIEDEKHFTQQKWCES